MSDSAALPRSRLEPLLRRRTSRDPLLRTLRELAAAERVPLWIVGGYVRDAALGRRAPDVDLVAAGGALRLVRSLQAAWGTSGFRFRKRGVTTWRFAVEDRRVDLVDAARRGLARDLARRELTINAVAFDLVTLKQADLSVKRVPDAEREGLAALRAALEREQASAHHVTDLAVGGDDLIAAGLAEGPELGRVLHGLLEAVLDDPERNDRDRLLALARELAG